MIDSRENYKFEARSIIALIREGVTYPFRKMQYLCHHYDSVYSFQLKG